MKQLFIILLIILLMGCATYKGYDIEPTKIETIESSAELKLVVILTLFFGSLIYEINK